MQANTIPVSLPQCFSAILGLILVHLDYNIKLCHCYSLTYAFIMMLPG